MPESDRRFESISGLLTQRGRDDRSGRRDPTRSERTAPNGAKEASRGDRDSAEVGPAAQLPKLRPRRDGAQGERASERSGELSADDVSVGEPGTTEKPAGRSGDRSAARGGARRVVVRLPAQLHAALVARVEREGSSQGHVVLDAIEYLYAKGELKEAIARTLPRSADSLFDRTRLRGRAEATVPSELGLRASTLEQVDRLAAENGAENRTQLVVVALAAYLQQEGQVESVAGERALREVR